MLKTQWARGWAAFEEGSQPASAGTSRFQHRAGANLNTLTFNWIYFQAIYALSESIGSCLLTKTCAKAGKGQSGNSIPNSGFPTLGQRQSPASPSASATMAVAHYERFLINNVQAISSAGAPNDALAAAVLNFSPRVHYPLYDLVPSRTLQGRRTRLRGSVSASQHNQHVSRHSAGPGRASKPQVQGAHSALAALPVHTRMVNQERHVQVGCTRLGTHPFHRALVGNGSASQSIAAEQVEGHRPPRGYKVSFAVIS